MAKSSERGPEAMLQHLRRCHLFCKRFKKKKKACSYLKHEVGARDCAKMKRFQMSCVCVQDLAHGLGELLSYEGNVEEDFYLTFQVKGLAGTAHGGCIERELALSFPFNLNKAKGSLPVVNTCLINPKTSGWKCATALSGIRDCFHCCVISIKLILDLGAIWIISTDVIQQISQMSSDTNDHLFSQQSEGYAADKLR